MLFDNDFGDGLVVFVDSYPGKATEPMLVQRVPQEGLTCDTVISGFDNARRKQFGLVLREVLLVLGYQFAWRQGPGIWRVIGKLSTKATSLLSARMLQPSSLALFSTAVGTLPPYELYVSSFIICAGYPIHKRSDSWEGMRTFLLACCLLFNKFPPRNMVDSFGLPYCHYNGSRWQRASGGCRLQGLPAGCHQRCRALNGCIFARVGI